jgi:hypothetical protein
MTRRHAPPLVQRDAAPRQGAQPSAGDVQRLADAGVRGATSALPHLDRISRSFGPGHDLAGVRAQVGGAGAAASGAMGAQAYATRGDRVAFAATPSLRVAAHEAAHLVQQKGGLSLPGGVGRTGDAHERHADAVADRVAAGRPAGDLLQRYARPQAKGAANALQPLAKPSPAGQGRSGVQMWKLATTIAPWMTVAGQWDANSVGGKASVGRAKNLKMKAAAVGVVAPGAGASPPAAKPKSWGQLKGWNLVHPNPPGYVRMHLIHDWMGGSGKDVNNLAPGTNTMNQKHLHKAEKPLMNALFNGGRVFLYTVKATYQKGGGGLVTAKGKKTWRNTLKKIVCNASYEPAAGAPKKLLHKTINEVGGITGKLNWLGH